MHTRLQNKGQRKTYNSEQAIVQYVKKWLFFIQCQMDSFRLVRYEMSTAKPICGVENILLQQRHNAAPGMVLVSKPTAGLARGCRLCSVHVFMAPTGWQQQCSPEAEEVIDSMAGMR